MKYRPLGRTGFQVSALALGTVELGLDYGIKAPGAYGRPSTAEGIRLVQAALAAGINFIDTARTYGDSEAVLGQALRGRRDQAILASKAVVHRPDGSLIPEAALKAHLQDSLTASLSALKTDYLDLWYIHNVDEAVLACLPALAECLASFRAADQIRAVGGSMYGADIPLAALESDLFDVMQVTYSVFDQRLADKVLPLAAKKQVGVVGRSVLLQGALTERGDHLPAHLAVLKDRSRQFRQIARQFAPDLSPAQLAIAFALAQPQLGAALVGVRSEAELNEDLAALQATLPSSLLQQLYLLRLDDPDLLDPGTWKPPV